MTDQELEQTVNATFNTIEARQRLLDALSTFVTSGTLLCPLLGRARAENYEPHVDRAILTISRELSEASMLREIMLTHEREAELGW